jgi:hypothetical protein
MGAAVHHMYVIKALAQQLMAMPAGDGKSTAGPTFEYVPPEQRSQLARRTIEGLPVRPGPR